MINRFKMMKLKGKLLLFTISMMIISIGIILTIVILNIYYQGKADVNDFKQKEIELLNQELENYIDVAHNSIKSNYQDFKNQAHLEKIYGPELTNVIDLAFSIIEEKIKLVDAGLIDIYQAQEQAKQAIRSLRFDENDIGYIWINDTTEPYPYMIMHPTSPQLDGKLLDDPKYKTAEVPGLPEGEYENLFKAIVTICNRDGSGFMKYRWPKPLPNGEKTEEKKLKLSYGRKFEKWGWILGTGIYIDEVEQEFKNKTIQQIEHLRYQQGKGYFWIHDKGTPFPTMIMHPLKKELEGHVLSDNHFNTVVQDSMNLNERNLYKAAVDISSSNQEGWIEYTEHIYGDKDTEEKVITQRAYIQYFPEWDWIIGTALSMEGLKERIQAKELAINDQIWLLTVFILGASLVVLGILILLLIVLINFLLKPLGSLRDQVTNAVADGNLSVAVEVDTADEFAEICELFNLLIDNIRDILQRMQHMTVVLNKSIQELNVSSKEISTTSNEQAAAVKEILTTMEDSDKLTKGIAGRINEVANISNTTKDNVDRGFNFIQENMTKMDEIKGTNEKTINGIKSLGEQIDSIWDVVNIINGIADQTKIIAFNAELEASSASEVGVGKNFQIVATEIRRLADNTVASTSEIKHKITEIQRASDNLILASEEGTVRIREGWEVSSNLRKIFEEILNSSEVSASSAQQIVLSTDQQVRAIEQILLTLKQISEGIDNFVTSTRSLTQAGESLQEIGDDLQSMSSSYKTE